MELAKRLGIIWDMDGVLVDTREAHFQSWQEVYRLNSGDDQPLSRERFAALFGVRNQETIEMMFGMELATPEFVSRVAAQKEADFMQRTRGAVTLLPGVADWLAGFQGVGLRQAVASSAPAEGIRAVMESTGAGGYFDTLVSGDADAELRSKPAPDIYLEAARRLAVEPAGCLVIEDAVVGVRGAKAAGMACLAVTTTHPASALAAADWVLRDFRELSPLKMLEMWAALSYRH